MERNCVPGLLRWGLLETVDTAIGVIEIADGFEPFVMGQEMLVNLTMVDTTSTLDAQNMPSASNSCGTLFAP